MSILNALPQADDDRMTRARRRLVEVISALGFGTIENLHVVHGEPAFDPPPRVVRELKLGAGHENEPLHRRRSKRHVRELFDALNTFGTGVISRIQVRHGLPHRLIVVLDEGGGRS